MLPLATIALDAAGIEYAVRSVGKADTMQWAMSQTPTIRPVVMEIVVTRDVAAQARDLVVDLERPLGLFPPEAAPAIDTADSPTIRLEDAATGIPIGAITEAQLQELSSHLKENAPQQYIVDTATIKILHEAHADAALVALLRQAVGGGNGLAIRWVI